MASWSTQANMETLVPSWANGSLYLSHLGCRMYYTRTRGLRSKFAKRSCWYPKKGVDETSNDWWLNAESQPRDVQDLNLFQTTHHQHLPSNIYYLPSKHCILSTKICQHLPTSTIQHIPSIKFWQHLPQICQHLPTSTIQHIPSIKFWQHLPQICQHLPTSTIQHIPSIKFCQHLPQIYQHHLTNLSGLGPPLVGTTDRGDFRGKRWRTQREKGNQLQLHIDSHRQGGWVTVTTLHIGNGWVSPYNPWTYVQLRLFLWGWLPPHFFCRETKLLTFLRTCPKELANLEMKNSSTLWGKDLSRIGHA